MPQDKCSQALTRLALKYAVLIIYAMTSYNHVYWEEWRALVSRSTNRFSLEVSGADEFCNNAIQRLV